MKTKEIKKSAVKSSVIAERLSTLDKQATPHMTRAANLQIRSQEDYQSLATTLAKIKEIRKLAVEEKEKFTKPLNELLRTTSAHFKPFFDKIDALEVLKKSEMVKYLNAQEAKQLKVQEKFDSGEIKKVSTLLGKQVELQTTSDDASVRRLKVVEITDERKLPREYLVPDLAKIKAALLAGETVAGARIVEQKSIAI